MGSGNEAAKRLKGWRERLTAVVEAHRAHSFVWGEHDCGFFAADCVEALIGVDPFADFRGRYKSYRDILRLMLAAGYENSSDFLRDRFTEIPPSRASIGDLVVVDQEGLGSVGVCVGAEIAAYGMHGIGFVPLTRGQVAFRI